MLYNYFSTRQFADLRLHQGYTLMKDFVYRGCFKQEKFFGRKFFINILKKIFPAIYIESDHGLLAGGELQQLTSRRKPFHIRGQSFQNLDLPGFSRKTLGTFIEK